MQTDCVLIACCSCIHVSVVQDIKEQQNTRRHAWCGATVVVPGQTINFEVVPGQMIELDDADDAHARRVNFAVAKAELLAMGGQVVQLNWDDTSEPLRKTLPPCVAEQKEFKVPEVSRIARERQVDVAAILCESVRFSVNLCNSLIFCVNLCDSL